MKSFSLTSISILALAELMFANASLDAHADFWSRNVAPIGHTGEKALHDVGHTGEKALRDTGKTIEKAVQDTGTAGETVYKFGVREIQSIGKMASDADKRLKEGKIVDAVWHFATDPLKHTEENAAKAAPADAPPAYPWRCLSARQKLVRRRLPFHPPDGITKFGSQSTSLGKIMHSIRFNIKMAKNGVAARLNS